MAMISVSAKFIAILTIFSALRVGAVTIHDNDTVVFLGNTVIERSQQYGYFEASLTLAADKKNTKFRNLG